MPLKVTAGLCQEDRPARLWFAGRKLSHGTRTRLQLASARFGGAAEADPLRLCRVCPGRAGRIGPPAAAGQRTRGTQTGVARWGPKQWLNGSPETANQRPGGSATNGHAATQKQLEYVHRLVRQIPGVDSRQLEMLVQRMFGKPLVGLTRPGCFRADRHAQGSQGGPD